MAILSRSYIFFFRAASCFTDHTFVSCSLIMYRAWANVLLPPKPVLKPQNAVHHIGRFQGDMSVPALLAGPAIEGRTKIGEHDIFESPMCVIPAGSGGLSAASENAIVVSPFPPRIIVCLRTRGNQTVARAARANEKFRLLTDCSTCKFKVRRPTLP